jgi:NAD(P)-dependent dehydrogenase (short-subunit alcohol dehydrogenase family)
LDFHIHIHIAVRPSQDRDCAAASAGAYNIRVNAVLPGAVDTAMLMGNLVEREVPAAYLDRMAQHSVLGRLATPEDIAHGVLMLADPASRAITGVFLPIDGGNLPGA